MFILIYFLVVALSQFAANKILGINDENEDSYSYSRRDSLILAILLVLGIALQVLMKIKFLNKIYWWLCLGYAVFALALMLVFITIKKSKIEKQREEIQQVYEILQKMVDKKNEGLDFNNVPFTLGYKYNKINKIDVVVEPVGFDEKILSIMLQQLNSFLPTFTWSYEKHLEERYITFIGNDKPPTIARWPGGWLRPLKAFPIGISGNGEICWQPDSVNKKSLGRSLFLDEKGNSIQADVSLSRAPQGLIAGGPLTLDTIIPTTTGYKTMCDISTNDYVFDIRNNPVKVVELQNIHMSNKLYQLVFQYDGGTITINADDIHRWPVYRDEFFILFTEQLEVGDMLPGIPFICTLISKTLIDNALVRCIRVDSKEHLFLIADKQYDWQGGKHYFYPSIYTCNTGG